MDIILIIIVLENCQQSEKGGQHLRQNRPHRDGGGGGERAGKNLQFGGTFKDEGLWHPRWSKSCTAGALKPLV